MPPLLPVQIHSNCIQGIIPVLKQVLLFFFRLAVLTFFCVLLQCAALLPEVFRTHVQQALASLMLLLNRYLSEMSDTPAKAFADAL